MKKNVNFIATCHDMGACLLRPGCPCAGSCDHAALRLAPGVIDGPYYRQLNRGQRAARALALVAIGLIAGVAALVQILPLARWL